MTDSHALADLSWQMLHLVLGEFRISDLIYRVKNSILKFLSPLTERFLFSWANSLLIGVRLETLRSRFSHFTANNKLRFVVNGLFHVTRLPIFGA